jgi:hypothetical protein
MSSDTGYVDPEELPFTRDEIYRASVTFLPESAAREMADHLTSLGPQLVAARVARRAGWQQARVAGARSMPLHAWVYPAQLLPALAKLSADVERRVVQLQQVLSGGGGAA